MKRIKLILVFVMGIVGVGVSSSVFGSVLVFAATYTASISTSGGINLDVSSTGNGANITTDNIGIVSTCPAGYTVSIAATSGTSTTFADTTLYKDGDKTNTAATKKINTSAGTIASPASILGNNNKTWGYTTQAINNGSAITINSNFVGLTTTQTNLATSATGTAATGITLPVYYGVSVDNTIEPGLYKMSDDAVITYYLTTSLDCTSYQVAFNPTSTAGGQTLSGTGTMDNQRIEEGVATNLTTNIFTAPSGYEFKEWNTAQDGTGTSYTNSQSVTDLTSVGNIITLYAQWEQEFTCPGGYICYNKNAASGVEGTMGNQTVSSDATSITLLASNFSRTGYGFVGWSEDKNVTNSSKIYGPQEDISFAAGTYASTGLKLYAVWVTSAGSIQNVATVSSVCNSLTTAPTDGTANLSSVSALTDQRDNNTYAIARLADGNCWMIENMRLENTNSDNATGTLAQGYNTSFAGLADPEAASLFKSTATANTLYSTDGSTEKTISGSNQGYRFPRYNNINTSSRASSPTTNDTAMYSYGNYYTWAAAIADTTDYTSNNTNVTNTSICPTGWHLPKGGDKSNEANNEFWSLVVTGINNGTNPANYESSTTPYYNGTAEAGPVADKLRSYPNNFVYSGGVSSGSVGARGSNGRYWSSSAFSLNAYYLNLGSSSVYPGTYGSFSFKYYGRAVRCVASALSMQNVDQWGDSLEIGDEITAVDSRDGSEYKIARLADGELWMTENLRLDFSKLKEDISLINTNNPTAAFISSASMHPATTNPANVAWCTTNNSSCDDKIQYSTVNIGDMTTDDFNIPYDEYGAYYNWYTATAGNGTYSKSTGNTSGDICPYGWHLPGGTSAGRFASLISALGISEGGDPAKLTLSPSNFRYSGSIYGSSVNDRGIIGQYWAETPSGTNSAYVLYMENDYDSWHFYTYVNTIKLTKNSGASVRCMAN